MTFAVILIALGVSNDSWPVYYTGIALLALDIAQEVARGMRPLLQRPPAPEPEPELPWFQVDKPMYPTVDDEFLSWERCLVVEYMADDLKWWELEDDLWAHLQMMRARQTRANWEKRPAAPVKVMRR